MNSKLNPSQKKSIAQSVMRPNINNKNDPITNAVVQNIMGTLPTRRESVKCILCNLEFSSQIILDAHLKGARHAKKLKSTNILETLKSKNVNYSRDEVSSGLKCNPCDVVLNSLQQLETHLSGNRHKKKVSTGDWSDKEIVTKTSLPTTPDAKKKLVESKMLHCRSCRKTFNSESQLNVHLSSKKHSDKVNGVISEKKKRFSPYYITKAAEIPLSLSFVPSSGYENNTEEYLNPQFNDSKGPPIHNNYDRNPINYESSSVNYDRTSIDYQMSQPYGYPNYY